jgi:hypothetical protein
MPFNSKALLILARHKRSFQLRAIVMTAMTVVSEAGYDMSKWKTEDHFVSWLRLCPDNRISGNKVIGKGRLPTNNPISIDQYPRQLKDEFLRSQRAILSLPQLYRICTELPEHPQFVRGRFRSSGHDSTGQIWKPPRGDFRRIAA